MPARTGRRRSRSGARSYFSTLTIPAAVFTLRRGDALPVALDATRVSFRPETGAPLVFHMTRPTDHAPTGPDVMPLVEGHLVPLIAILKKHSGLSTRLFWQNAGWYLVWILSEMGRQHPAHSAAIRDILADWPEQPARTDETAALKELPVDRRVCRLRYRIPGFDRCKRICPWGRTIPRCIDLPGSHLFPRPFYPLSSAATRFSSPPWSTSSSPLPRKRRDDPRRSSRHG